MKGIGEKVIPLQTSIKQFVEEKTKEVLIVATDGCYTYKQDPTGSSLLCKLNDVRDILGAEYMPHILPGQSATGTPTTQPGTTSIQQ